MFDAQIVPLLLYSSEVWGHTENKEIEKLHLYACKLFLNVPISTPNDMVYAELDRYPLYIESAARCLQFWFRLLKQESSRFSKMAYQSLLTLHEKGNKNWVTFVKSLLCESGYEVVWIYGSVGNEKRFLREFKERLRANFSLRWLNHLSQSNRFERYNNIKGCIEKETYIDLIKANVYRTALARFRTGVSPFNAHKHRYSLTDESRACPFCPLKKEDEEHVLLDCPKYSEIRERYVALDLVCNVPVDRKVISLLSSKNNEVLIDLGKFLFLAWKKREEKNST